MSDWIKASLYTAAIGLFMLYFVSMVFAGQECERKGGVLMKPAVGFYSCVKPVK